MGKRRRRVVSLLISVLMMVGCSPLSLPTSQHRQSGGGRAPAQELVDAEKNTTYPRVAFIYSGSIDEQGWTWSHDQGRRDLHDHFPNVETAYQENVSVADAERSIRDFARQGFQVIFTTSKSYTHATIAVANDFPETVFVNIAGHKTAPNVGTAFGKIEEPRYISGLIAGMMTKSNIVGFVAAFPIPEVFRTINAFSLGVRKGNPNARVRVTWTNSWLNARREHEAATALIDGGADVIGQQQATPAVQQVVKARGKYGVGSNATMSTIAPRAILTSVLWNWGVFYTDVVQQVQAGTWKSQSYWGGWKDGVVDLTPISPLVPRDIRDMVEKELAEFKAGEQTISTIFTGPLNDQNGSEIVPAGKSLNTEELLNMSWLVEGVEVVVHR